VASKEYQRDADGRFARVASAAQFRGVQSDAEDTEKYTGPVGAGKPVHPGKDDSTTPADLTRAPGHPVETFDVEAASWQIRRALRPEGAE